MDRISIKKRAREYTRKNKWNYWKVALLAFLIMIVLESIIIAVTAAMGGIGAIISMLLTLGYMPLMVGLMYCLLQITRDKKYNINDLFKFFKFVVPIFVLMFLVTLLTTIGLILLIIPGIIISLMFSMVMYIFADGETSASACMRKSRELMRGHKLDYFILYLSFIGWMLLVPFTLGLLLIWLVPYIQFSSQIFYEDLLAKKENSLTN